jgi:hypothetical protein
MLPFLNKVTRWFMNLFLFTKVKTHFFSSLKVISWTTL